MFGRRDEETNTGEQESATAQSATTPRSIDVPQPRVMAAPSPLPGRRRPGSMEQQRARPSVPKGLDTSDERTLTVGKGLSLTGEISACDVLVVEGKVDAKLTDGKLLEITESGQFRGSVEIENADIAGRYDGDLTVHGRLTIRGTGRITGIIKYGELEVSAGGQIIGEMQVVGAGSAVAGPSFKSAAKFTAMQEILDDDEETTPFARKTAAGA
ncbi:MAG: polymer-forming cytoskeletal protein [Alphaproteobacteria bacterium]|nr:polymer-forming cytoskeletal protein [Alphaproteobacteria bacterium]